MAQIDIYTTQICPYCDRAKHLLKSKDAPFTEHDLTNDDDAREALVNKTGMRTVPQIFIDDKLVGGCDDLYALNKSGELDKLLAGV